MKLLSVDEQTYSRLGSIMNDMMHTEKRNINYDDVLNELNRCVPGTPGVKRRKRRGLGNLNFRAAHMADS